MDAEEFRQEVQAFEDRQTLEWERAAWIVAMIINASPYTKKPIKDYRKLLRGSSQTRRVAGDPWP